MATFYIENVTVTGKKKSPQRITLGSLTTTKNKSLPEFTSAPFVDPAIANNGTKCHIVSVDTTGFEIAMSAFTPQPASVEVNLTISSG